MGTGLECILVSQNDNPLPWHLSDRCSNGTVMVLFSTSRAQHRIVGMERWIYRSAVVDCGAFRHLSGRCFFTPEVFAVLRWVTIGAGMTALIGFLTPVSLFVFALGNWIFIAHQYSYADIHHPESIWCIFLMSLAFATSGKYLAVDNWLRRWRMPNLDHPSSRQVTLAVWPLKLAFVLLSWIYLSTGMTKLIYGGLEWFNGYTLQSYILQDAIKRSLPLGIWVAQQHTLCIVLSVFTVGFELFFAVSIFVRRTLPYFLIAGILFQLGLYVIAGHAFFQHILLLILLFPFVDFERWDSWLNKSGFFASSLSTARGRKLSLHSLSLGG